MILREKAKHSHLKVRCPKPNSLAQLAFFAYFAPTQINGISTSKRNLVPHFITHSNSYRVSSHPFEFHRSLFIFAKLHYENPSRRQKLIVWSFLWPDWTVNTFVASRSRPHEYFDCITRTKATKLHFANWINQNYFLLATSICVYVPYFARSQLARSIRS